MIRQISIIIIVLFHSTTLLSQGDAGWKTASKEEIANEYRRVCDWFVATSNYSFNMKYTSFRNHHTNEIIESSAGYYKRQGSKYKSEAVGIKTIQNEKVKIVVDTADKVIALTNPGTLSPTMQQPAELVKLLENVKALKKKTVNKSTLYRIDFKKNELYESYELMINEKGHLEKLVFYYAEQTEKDYGDGENEQAREFKIKPRMEIDFSNYTINSKIPDNEFTDKYIVLADNKKVTLLDKYNSFQVKDYRALK